MTPSQMLDMHMDLIRRLEDPGFRRTVSSGYYLDRFALHSWENASREPEKEAQQQSEYMTHVFDRSARAAERFYVTKDMGQLLGWAAASLEGTDKIDVSLAPSRSGLVRFEQPIELIEARGRKMKVHWLVWGPIRLGDGSREGTPYEGTLLTWFNDGDDPDEVALNPSNTELGERLKYDDEQMERIKRVMGRWLWVGTDVITDDMRLGPASMRITDEVREEILADGDVPADEGTNMVRYAHALWLMLGQTITVSREATLDRSSVRRAKKKNLPSRVNVISLRRAVYADDIKREGESEVEWKHRWIVRGHWRWQHVSPHHPLAQEVAEGDYRARLWIAPFIKGPEGAPLHQSAKVYALRR